MVEITVIIDQMSFKTAFQRTKIYLETVGQSIVKSRESVSVSVEILVVYEHILH